MKQLELFSVEKSTSDVSYLLEDERTDSESELRYYDYVLSESICTTRNDSESRDIPELSESSSGTVQIYQSGGTSRGNNSYYRYMWFDGDRVRHRHIKGGNTCNPVAQKRVAMILTEIGLGRSPEYILEMIKSF